MMSRLCSITNAVNFTVGRLRLRRVQHQHGGDDRQRREGNDERKRNELGQFRGPTCRHPRNLANLPGLRGTSAAARAPREWTTVGKSRMQGRGRLAAEGP